MYASEQDALSPDRIHDVCILMTLWTIRVFGGVASVIIPFQK